jgi:hypothetical protein
VGSNSNSYIKPVSTHGKKENQGEASRRMHGDEQKNMVADTLEYALFAHHNLEL